MDPMIAVGLMNPEEKIREIAMEYLNIKTLDDQKQSMVTCKRMVILLIEELINPEPPAHEVARLVGVSRGLVSLTKRNHSHEYKKDNKIYSFIYTNIKRKFQKKSYFELSDFYRVCIARYPDTNDLTFYNAKPLSMYLVRQNISNAEANHMLGLPHNTKPLQFELEQKDLYLSAIDSTLDEMLGIIKNNNQ